MNPIGDAIEDMKGLWAQIEDKFGEGIERTYKVGEAIEEKLFANPEVWVPASATAYIVPTRSQSHEVVLIDMENVRNVLLEGKLPVLSFSICAGREIDAEDQGLAQSIVEVYNQNITTLVGEALEKNEPLQKLLGTVGSIADEGVEIIITKGLITKILGGVPGLVLAALWNKPRETVDFPAQIWSVLGKYSGLVEEVDAKTTLEDIVLKNIGLTDSVVHPILYNLAANIAGRPLENRMIVGDGQTDLPAQVLQTITQQI